jgi:FtsH ternary system domain X1
VQRVLQWAASPGSSAPPQGDLAAVDQLTKKQPQLLSALKELWCVTSARLRLPPPPLGDTGPITCDVLLMAAAVGFSAQAEISATLARLAEPATTPSESILRHGLACPALRFIPAKVAEALRFNSPLTAVLERPARGMEVLALDGVRSMLKTVDGRRLLTLEFAHWPVPAEVRDWRTGVLDRLRQQSDLERSFVIDVYEAALVHNEDGILREIKESNRAFTVPGASHADMENAMSVAKWWGPLAGISRSHADELRVSMYLKHSYLEGIKLFRLATRWGVRQ